MVLVNRDITLKDVFITLDYIPQNLISTNKIPSGRINPRFREVPFLALPFTSASIL